MHDFLGEAIAIFGDRVGMLAIMASLMVHFRDFASTFAALLLLDIATIWFQVS